LREPLNECSQFGRSSNLKRCSTVQRIALNGIAVLACSWYLAGWTLGDGARSGSEITSIPQRIELHAKYRSCRKACSSDAWSCNGSGAGHFNSPRNRLSIFSSHRLAIRPERHEVNLSMIRLRDKSRQYSRQCDGFRLVVHGKRVMR